MAIFHRPLPRTQSAALRDMDESNVVVRRSAVRDLARYALSEPEASVIDALIKALRDKDPLVRKEAAYALGDAKAEKALPSLLLAVDDEHSAVRQAAIDALGLIGDERAVQRLRRAVGDERGDVRFQSLIALSRLVPDEALELALQRMDHDDDPEVRYIALRVLEEMAGDKPSVKSALELSAAAEKAVQSRLQDAEPRVRLAAAILLARHGDTSGAKVLIDVIEDRFRTPEGDDEAAAVMLAGSLGLDQAVVGLERRAFGLRRFVRERYAWLSLVALAQLGHQRARQRILRDLGAWTRQQRTLAVTAAGQAGLREAKDRLLQMRGDQVRADPEAVEEALGLLDALPQT